MKTMKSFRVKKLFHLAKKAPKAVLHHIIHNGYRGYKRKKTKIYHFFGCESKYCQRILAFRATSQNCSILHQEDFFAKPISTL